MIFVKVLHTRYLPSPGQGDEKCIGSVVVKKIINNKNNIIKFKVYLQVLYYSAWHGSSCFFLTSLRAHLCRTYVLLNKGEFTPL